MHHTDITCLVGKSGNDDGVASKETENVDTYHTAGERDCMARFSASLEL